MSFGRRFVAFLSMAAGCAVLGASSDARADLWSPLCTPDLIHLYPDKVTVRCQENGYWYHIWYADYSNGHVDRIVRALQAVQLSGKKVQFRDVGTVDVLTNRKFDMLALPK